MSLAWKFTIGVGLVAALAGAWAAAGSQRRVQLGLDLLEVTQRRDPAAVRSLLNSGADPRVRSEYDATPLHHAEAAADGDSVIVLSEHGADLNARDRSGRTAIQRSSIRGDLQMVLTLLDLGANPSVKDITGRTALISAAAGGHDNIVSVLLNAGADTRPIDRRGMTALHMAAGNRFQSAVELLLRHGADPRPPSRPGMTPVLAALRRHSGASPLDKLLHAQGSTPLVEWGRDGRPGLSKIVRSLARRGADLASRTVEGHTVMDLCVGQVDGETVDELRLRGASRNPTTDLLLAIWLDRPQEVRAALAAGGSPNGRTAWGESALWLAACTRRLEIANFLLSRGADPDRGRNGWSTPLGVASALGDEAMVRMLLRFGSRINFLHPIPGEQFQTPLLAAITRRHPRIVRLLLEAGADVNQSDWSGYTPLMAAASLGDPQIVRLLIDGGALVNGTTTVGDTALTRACMSGHPGVVELLLKRGADPTIRNDQDYSLVQQLDLRKGLAGPQAIQHRRIEALLRQAIEKWPSAPDTPGERRAG